MVNCNGNIQENSGITIENNRGFLFGDSVFETLKVVQNKVLFLEDHYFRLMASMRICRMEIPMNFTLEFIEEEILKLTAALEKANAYRVRFTIFRAGQGLYLPQSNAVQYVITGTALDAELYALSQAPYEIELFKDAYITKQLFSTLKTNNKMIQIAGSIFAAENDYQNCLLLNDEKNVVEALQSNVFMRMGTTIVTPPVEDGCLKGIMRKQVLEILQKLEGYTVEERSISPFDLQKADELFLTNVITGVQPVTQYRKKTFVVQVATTIVDRLNAKIRLN